MVGMLIANHEDSFPVHYGMIPVDGLSTGAPGEYGRPWIPHHGETGAVAFGPELRWEQANALGVGPVLG